MQHVCSTLAKRAVLSLQRTASFSGQAAAADEVGCVVIGGGVVGLAVARALASRVDTLVVEQHEAIGMETSSRNSEGACIPAFSCLPRRLPRLLASLIIPIRHACARSAPQ